VTPRASAPAAKTRDIARTAVQTELAQAAFDLFLDRGFQGLTIGDFADAAGVSRSTFLRYFGDKEEAVLWVVEARGGQLADAIRARPAREGDWTALRRAFEDVFASDLEEPDGIALKRTRMIREDPALAARQLEKQQTYWRPAVAQALADRAGRSEGPSVADEVRAAAALGCMDVAVARWIASDAGIDLFDVLDEAFAGVAR
jgi:AcrR family transcriptional regulator